MACFGWEDLLVGEYLNIDRIKMNDLNAQGLSKHLWMED